MFYLDCILYITLILLAWVLIDKIVNDPKEGFNTKEGFKHKGKAFVADNKKKMDLSALNPNTKRFDFFKMAELGYNGLSVIADVFVKYPNQYVMKLGNMAQGPLESLMNNFKAVLKKSQDQAEKIINSIKPYFTFAIPFSLYDLTKIIKKMIDKIFASLGDILKPKNPNS